jgi:endonuclease YncB( thermonuclease family)
MRGGTEETKALATKARDRVRELCLGQDVLLRTHKDGKGKYGRWLAEVITPEDGDLSKLLLAEDLAVVYGE